MPETQFQFWHLFLFRTKLIKKRKENKIKEEKIPENHRQLIKKITDLNDELFKAPQSLWMQSFLEKFVILFQFLMGIGSGTGVKGSGEKAVFDLMKKTDNPPYIIFDVGSNKGQFLQLIKENTVDLKTDIHCFEPGHTTFQILEQIEIDGKSIHLNNVGLSSKKGESVLYYDSEGSGLASQTKRKLDHFGIYFGKEEKISVETLDNYCQQHAIDHIHLLKMDIEGHELDALQGAKRMFEDNAIDMVTFEFGGCNIDTRTFFQDFWYFFLQYQFKLFRITPSGYLSPLESYHEHYEQFRTTNYLAVSPKVPET